MFPAIQLTAIRTMNQKEVDKYQVPVLTPSVKVLCTTGRFYIVHVSLGVLYTIAL